jgi:hypothetical protein
MQSILRDLASDWQRWTPVERAGAVIGVVASGLLVLLTIAL